VLLVLLSNLVASGVLVKFLKGTWKFLWICVLGMWAIILTLSNLVFTGPGGHSFILACVLGGILSGVALTWYFGILWPAFASLIPNNKSAQYVGLLYCVQSMGLIVEPFLYVGIVQSSNNHRFALFTLVPWAVIGAGIMLSVNFEKGKRDSAVVIDKVASTTGNSVSV